MLKEFTIKNFTSFRDETLFSMEADTERVSEFPEHVVHINGNALLKVASMYGPNGGGKSNALQALHLARWALFGCGMRADIDLQNAPCIFTDSRKIEETVFFADDMYEMGYRFCIVPVEPEEEYADMPARQRAYDLFEIEEEQVSFRRKDERDFVLLLARDKTGAVESETLRDVTKERLLAKRKSVIGYLYDTFADSNEPLPESLDVIRRLAVQIRKIVPLDYYVGMDVRSLRMLRTDRIRESKDKLIDALGRLDIGIKDIRIYEKRRCPVYFVREVFTGNQKSERELPLTSESEGTQKVFWMLYYLLGKMEKGKIFFCDDMNAYLHPKLLRAVIRLFQENENGSQLIFNSHDIVNMDNTLFRRDEIWFVYRDESYATQMVPLSNIENYKGEQVRKDAKYYKQYLEGKYGADPFIQRGLKWNA